MIIYYFAILFSAKGWYIGGPAESCDTACHGHSLTCNEKGYEDHYSDVDSSEKVFNLIKKLGGKMLAESCNRANFPAVPVFKSDVCAYSDTTEMFDCSSQPLPIKENKQRLCYCQQIEGK